MSSTSSKYADCKELFAVLSQYLDAELSPTDCAAIEKHISGCAPCVEFVNSLKKSVELCRTASMESEPHSLPDAVREQLLQAYRRSLEESSKD